jgi:hypothetical protein
MAQFCDNQLTNQTQPFHQSTIALFLSHNRLLSIDDITHLCKDLVILDVSFNNLKEFKSTDFQSHPHLAWLLASNNSFTSTPWLSSAYNPHLKWLDLSSNPLRSIGFLVGFHDLQVLNLANCLLESIIAADFGDLKQLRVLVLSHNRLSSLGISPQLHSMQLSSLDVRGNDIKLLEDDVDILRESSLKSMRAETSDAILCALSGTRISFKTKISRSVLCLRLIPKYEMRVIVASIMTAIAVLNGGVIIWRCNLQKQNVVSSYLVITAMLNISCGVHLGIILLADKLYARHFYVHREAWRASRLCQVSLLITHLESQLTAAIATLVTWEKHKAVSALHTSRGRKGPLLLAVLATLTLTASALRAPPRSHHDPRSLRFLLRPSLRQHKPDKSMVWQDPAECSEARSALCTMGAERFDFVPSKTPRTTDERPSVGRRGLLSNRPHPDHVGSGQYAPIGSGNDLLHPE